jgi:N-acetylglucosamine kinase-like BadF-type ATPase
MMVIAGTGSICFGRNECGESARTGGGGPVISDEGSGDWIGRRAVQEALAAINSEASVLFNEIAKVWAVREGAELQRQLNSEPAPDFAALFPTVQNIASNGDQAAVKILREAGTELAKLAEELIRQLWRRPQRVRVAMSGGVFENSALVRDTFVTRLRANLKSGGFEIAVSFGLAEPVMGALALARKAALASAAHIKL